MSQTPTPPTPPPFPLSPRSKEPLGTPTWPAEAAKVLHFTLAWAGPCKTYTNVILPRVVAAGFTVPIETLDVDEHQDRAHAHDIRAVPTLIMLDAAGRILGTLEGMRPEPTLREWLAKPGENYPL